MTTNNADTVATAPSLLVVLDANVLFPTSLRDTLLRAVERRLFDRRLSQQIWDETLRNLLATGRLTPEQIARLDTQVQIFLSRRGAFVEGYETLIPALTNHKKDRHVLAAAIHSNSHIIVTFNLKDFPIGALAPHNAVSLHPDVFLTRLHALYPDALDSVITQQAAALKKPPVTVERLLDILAQHVPMFVQSARPRLPG